jgi:hypothetical protein
LPHHAGAHAAHNGGGGLRWEHYLLACRRLLGLQHADGFALPMEGAVEELVRSLQDRVNAALLESDWATLNDLIAPDARIIGPKGFVIDRNTWIGVSSGE